MRGPRRRRAQQFATPRADLGDAVQPTAQVPNFSLQNIYRETGEATPRKQGQPSCSRLDPHEGFILGLIDDPLHMTSTEIGEFLAEAHDVKVVPSTIWYSLDKCGVTFKNRLRMSPNNSARTS